MGIFEQELVKLQQGDSDTIYKNNMDALKLRNESLYQLLMDTEEADYFEVFQKDTGSVKNLFNHQHNRTCYDIDNPIEGIKTVFDEKNIKFARMVGFYGFNLGYELFYYKTYLKEKCFTDVIYIVEKDIQLFKQALKLTDFTSLFNELSIAFLVGLKPEEIKGNFNIFLNIPGVIETTSTMEIIISKYATDIENVYYLDAVKRISEIIKLAFIRAGNSHYDSLLGLHNTFANIDDIMNNPGVNMLIDKFKGKPAVILSSGPSLQPEIPLIEGIKDKALVFSAESTLKILVNNGVTPHIMCTTERDDRPDELVDHFQNEALHDVYMACCSVIPPDTMMKTYCGPKLMAYRSYPYCQWLEIERGMHGFGGSSSTMAFQLAILYGCDPIILVGQDLCYNKKTQASHTAGHGFGTEQFADERKSEIPTNDGGTALTNDTWIMFKDDLERYTRLYGANCINTAKEGAYIEGATYMPFSEAIEKYISEDIYPLETIKDALKEFEPTSEEHKEALIEKFNDAIDYIDGTIDICQEAIDYISSCHDVFDKSLASHVIDKETVDKEKEALEKIDEFIAQIARDPMSYFIFIHGICRPLCSTNEMDIENTPKYYDDYAYALMVMILKYKKYFADLEHVLHDILRELKLGMLVLNPDYEVDHEALEKMHEYQYTNDPDCSPGLDVMIKKAYFNEDISIRGMQVNSVEHSEL